MNTKDLRNKIKSVSSTLQLTSAMGLVASSKIKRASENMAKHSLYSSVVEEALASILSARELTDSVFVKGNGSSVSKIIVISGDRGLAGSYNSNVFKLADRYKSSEFTAIGKKAFDKYKSGIASSEKCSFEELFSLSDSLCSLYKNGVYGKLGIIYTKYLSALKSEAQIKWLLPLSAESSSKYTDMIFEPDIKAVLNSIVREYIFGVLVGAVKESYACEVYARKTAMNSAEKNAQEMIDSFNIEYNMARQGAITREIGEIIAGSGL